MAAALMLSPGAKVLDLGCGEGRNAIYLASLGLRTSAVDISSAGIEKLNTISKERGFTVNATRCDMREYTFTESFDLVVCLGCLHLVERDNWKQILVRIKKSTAKGGLNVIGVFTDKESEPEDQRGLMIGMFKEGELIEHYQDWDVLESKNIVFKDEHPGNIRHKHAANGITARKS